MLDWQQQVAAPQGKIEAAGFSEIYESRKGQDWVTKWQYWGELAMTCEDVERVLPELIEGTPDITFERDFEIHLQSCSDCSDLVSNLKLISSSARQMADSEEPAPQVWLRIAAELRAEGIIRESELVQARLVRSPSRWGSWWLVPVAAALLAAGAYE